MGDDVMSGVWEKWITGIRLPWMGTKGKRIMGGFAAALGDRGTDPQVGWARKALLEGLPLRASRAANNMHAADRGLILGEAETDANVADRVARAVLQSRYYGTPIGMLLQLHFLGATGAVIVQQNGLAWRIDGTPSIDDLELYPDSAPSWFTKQTLGLNPPIPASTTDGKAAIAAGTVPWWTFDGHMDANGDQYNARFGVLFPSDRLPTGWDAAVDPPTTVSVPTKETVNRMIRIVNRWRPAMAKPTWIKIVTAGNVWGYPPTMAWGDVGLVWGGGTVVTYSATTEY